MKLRDQLEPDDRLPSYLAEHLRALDLTELHSIQCEPPEGAEGRWFAVACDRGVFRGYHGRQPELNKGEVGIGGELTPWGEVWGARVVSAGYTGNDVWVTTVRVAQPEIKSSAWSNHDAKGTTALLDFGYCCMTLQRAWATPPDAAAGAGRA